MSNKAKIAVSLIFFVICLFVIGCAEQSKIEHQEPLGPPPEDAEYGFKKLYYQKQLEQKYENPWAHYQLAKLYFSDGWWNKAQFHGELAVQFSPMMFEAQALVIKTLIASGKESLAKVKLKEYTDLAGDDTGKLYMLGKQLRENNLNQYAYDIYQSAYSDENTSADITRELGYYYLARGQKVMARKYFVESFELDPFQKDVAWELGRLGVAVKVQEKQDTQTEQQIEENEPAREE